MFLPHHHIIVFQFFDGSLSQFYRAGQCIRHHAQATRAECFRFRNHAPQKIACHVFCHKLLIVGQRYQFDGMGMQGSLVVHAFRKQVIVYAQVRRKFRSGFYRLVGDDDIAGAIIQDTDNRTVCHRVARQVAHTLLRTLAIEITSLQVRKCRTDLFYFADSGQSLDGIVHIFRNINRNVSAITFSPTFLPQITCNFCHFTNLGC